MSLFLLNFFMEIYVLSIIFYINPGFEKLFLKNLTLVANATTNVFG